MKILVATDGSEYSDLAVDEVARRLWEPGTQVEVLSVAYAVPLAADPMVAGAVAVGGAYFDSLEQARHRAGEIVASAAARLRSRAAQLDVTTRVLEGTPHLTIVDEAAQWGADLVFVGSHGYGFLSRLLLGSVSHAVALHAPCSVEVVRRRGTA